MSKRIPLALAVAALGAGVLAACGAERIDDDHRPIVTDMSLDQADATLGRSCADQRVLVQPDVDLAAIDHERVTVYESWFLTPEQERDRDESFAVLHEGAQVTPSPSVEQSAGPCGRTVVLRLAAIVPDVVQPEPLPVSEAVKLLLPLGLVPSTGGAGDDDPVIGQGTSPGTLVRLDQGATVPLIAGVAVPDVVELTVEQACAELRGRSLNCARADAGDDAVVTQQSPAAGTGARGGQAVRLFVGTTPEEVVVPDIGDRTGVDYCREAENVELSCAFEGNAQDRVTAVEPAARASVAQGTTVTVRTAPRLELVPNLLGKPMLSACGLVQDRHFDCAVEPADAGDNFVVVDQSPEGDETAPLGSRVTVIAYPRLPNVVGMTQTEAQAAVAGLGLSLVISGEKGRDTVVRQSPAEGTVEPGSTVTVWFYELQWYETVPGQIALWLVSGIVAALGGIILRASLRSARNRRERARVKA